MEVLSSELVVECLIRVPYKEHGKLKAVCKTWKAMVSSPTFYADRKISGTSQQLIACLMLTDCRIYTIMVYDPLEGTSERLPPIDDPECPGIPVWCQCAAVKSKLLIIGRSHPLNGKPMKTVYIYDFETARWSRGADMPTLRSFFTCCVSPSTGLVYIAGGSQYRNRSPDAEAYNLEEDRWEILPPMIQQRGLGCHGFFLEDKFMVVRGHEFDSSAEVFDPSAGTWSRWENMWGFPGENIWDCSGWRSGAVAAFSGDLYVFIQRGVMKYDREKNVWSVVASLPQYTFFLMCATQCRHCIFVSGHDEIWYMFNPSTGQFNEFNSSSGGLCISATTVEI